MVGWFEGLQQAFKLERCTVAAATDYLDRYLSQKSCTPLNFQLVSVGCLFLAVRIRLFAVINYRRVIHEFDPWFNFRATEYMIEHGWSKFQAWYDNQAWYPLGRHVGSTTYPGLQLTAWGLHSFVNLWLPASINDVCVLLPAGFGAIATAIFAPCRPPPFA